MYASATHPLAHRIPVRIPNPHPIASHIAFAGDQRHEWSDCPHCAALCTSPHRDALTLGRSPPHGWVRSVRQGTKSRALNPGLRIPDIANTPTSQHPNIPTSQHPIPPTTPTPPADPTPSLSPNLSLSPSPRSLPHALAPSALCCPVPLSPVDRCVSVYRVDDGARLFRFSDSLQDVYAVTATDRGASDVLAVGGLRAAELE